MIVCPACNHRNQEGATVCAACGRSLERFVYRACPACGALNAAQDAFCRRCLHALSPISLAESAFAEEAGIYPLAPQEAGPAADAVSDTTRHNEETSVLASQPETGNLKSETVLGPEPLTGREIVLSSAVDPLEGLADLLPIEAAVLLPHHPAPLVSRPPSREEERAAELFRHIATEGVPSSVPSRAASVSQAGMWPRLGQVFLNLLVLLVALVPLFTGGVTVSLVRPRDSVLALVRALNALPADSAVLISFDYTPAYAGEMAPLALALVRQLAGRPVRTIVMSTRPEGIGLAESVCATVARETPAWRYGQSYALLGYLSGQEAGLRTLNESIGAAFKSDLVQRRAPADLPVLDGITTLQNVQRIIVLADDSDSVRRWIEQIQSRDAATLDALVTAGVEPVLYPYYHSGQLRSLVSGAPGAAEYEAAGHLRPYALKLTDGYAALLMLLVLIALATNVAGLAGWVQRRRRGR